MPLSSTTLRRLAPCALVLGLAACASPPPSHLTRLWVDGRTGASFYGLSTEDGVIVQPDPQWQVGDRFELHFPSGNSFVRDWGRLDRRNDDLAIIRPLTARLLEGRLATQLPKPYETLYVALRDEFDNQVMEPVTLWREGEYGDWITPPGGASPDAFAREWAGVGVYVKRSCRFDFDWFQIHRICRWEIIGLLTDLTARRPDDDPDEGGVGFVGIAELSRVLPDQVDYFDHPIMPPRPDFEFGVPLQPGDIVLPEEEAPPEDDAASGTSGRP